MSVFNLPSVRIPILQHTAGSSGDDTFINESLLEYIDQLKHLKTDSYANLSTVCGIEAPIAFFKYVEIFQTFPFQRTPVTYWSSAVNEAAVKALRLVRNGVADQSGAGPEDADVILGEVGNAPMYEIVRVALQRQKLGGSLILHVPDLFNKAAVQLLYLIAACYKTVCIYTPMVHTGQTKFIVAANLQQHSDLAAAPPYTFTPTQLFLTKLIEINTMIGQKRLEQIRFTTMCDYECVIWKAKYLSTLHDVHVNFNGGGNQVKERLKAAHSNAVN